MQTTPQGPQGLGLLGGFLENLILSHALLPKLPKNKSPQTFQSLKPVTQRAKAYTAWVPAAQTYQLVDYEPLMIGYTTLKA